jgi:hypothetical protein
MAHPYHHSLSSVRKWGGTVEDYLAIHSWFDASKEIIADFRHRALRHHAEGIFMAETIFGPTITLSSGRVIPTPGSASSTSSRISASSRASPTGLKPSGPNPGWVAPGVSSAKSKRRHRPSRRRPRDVRHLSPARHHRP